MASEFPSACRYFLTYSGVKLPFKLQSPLLPQQTENRNTYFRGYFDHEDRLLGFQKIVYGACELEHRYQYDEQGSLLRAEITDIDGEVTVLRFDAAGQPYQI